VLELRAHIDDLRSKHDQSEESKKRLQDALKKAQAQDKKQSELLETLSRELNESTGRESNLRSELDACRVKLEGFEMVQFVGESDDDALRRTPSDMATALVVSEKQNQALQAHLDELQTQNLTYQKKISELEKEVLPKDEKEKQLYSRYVEMKASLSSLAGVLEEVNGQNQMLNSRVVQLEAELRAADGTSNAASLPMPSPEQSEQLQNRVGALEQQVDSLLETEKFHNVRCIELKATVENLSSSTNSVKSQLDRVSLAQNPTDAEKEVLQEKFRQLEGIVQTMSQAEQSYKEHIQALDRSRNNIPSLDSNPSEQGVEMAATPSVDFTSSIDHGLATLSSESATTGRVAESSSSAWTSSGPTSSEEELTVDDNPRLKEVSLYKNRLEMADQKVAKLSMELNRTKTREDGLKKAVEKLTQKLRTANDDEKRVKLREEIDSLKDAMETAAAESFSLLGEMESLLASTQGELQKERTKTKDLTVELEGLKNEMQDLEADASWEASNSKNYDTQNENEHLKKQTMALKKELKTLKVESAKRQAELESLLARTKDELALEHQKVALMSKEAANRRKLQERLASTRNELSSFNIIDFFAPAFHSDGASSSDIDLDGLRKKNAELLSENAALKSEMQKELSRIKREVMSIRSQEMDKEENEQKLVQELKAVNSHLQLELDNLNKSSSLEEREIARNLFGLEKKNIALEALLERLRKDLASSSNAVNVLKSELEATKNSLVTERRHIQKLNGAMISLRMEFDTQMDSTISNSRAELSKERHKVKELSITITALRNEVDAFKADIKAANDKVSQQEEESRVAKSEAAGERKKVEELSAAVKSMQNDSRNLGEIVRENTSLRSEICNLKGDHEMLFYQKSGLEDQKQQLEESLADKEKQLAVANDKIQELGAKVILLEAKVEVLNDSVKAYSEEATSRKVELSSSLAASQMELAGEKQKVDELKSANAALLIAVESLKKNLENVSAQAATTVFEKEKLEMASQAEMENLTMQIFTQKQEIEALTIANSSLQKESSVLKEVAEEATTRLAKTKEELGEIDSQFCVSKLKLNSLGQDKLELQRRIDVLQSEFDGCKDQLHATEELKQTTEALLSETKVLLSTECQKTERLEAEKLSLQSQIDGLRAEITSALSAKDEAEMHLSKTSYDLEAERQRAESLEVALEKANFELTTLEQLMKISTTKMTELETLFSNTRTSLNETQLILDQTIQKECKLQLELSEVKFNFVNSQKREEELETVLNSTNNALEQTQAVADQLQQNKASLEGLRDDLKQKLGVSSTRVAELETTLAEKEELLQSNRLKIEELTIESISVRAELNSLQGHIETTNTRASMVTDYKAELEILLRTTKELLENERQNVQKLNSSRFTLQSEIDAMKAENGSLQSQLKALNDVHLHTEDELAALKVLINNEKQTTSSLNAEVNDLRSQQQDLKNEVASANAHAALMAEHQKEAETLLQNTKELLEAEKKKVEEIATAKTSIEVTLESCRNELNELKAEMDSAFSRANFASKKKVELERALASNEEERQKAGRSVNNLTAMNAVLRKELNNLRGGFENASTQAIKIKETYEKMLSEIKLDLSNAKEELVVQKKNAEKLASANEMLAKKLEDVKLQRDTERTACDEKIRMFELKLLESRENLHVERQKVEELKRQKIDVETDLVKLKSDVKMATEKASSAEGDLGATLASMEWELIAEQQKVDELSTSNASMESELKIMKERLAKGSDDVTERCHELEILLRSTKQELAKADKTVAECKVEAISLKKQIEDGKQLQCEITEKLEMTRRQLTDELETSQAEMHAAMMEAKAKQDKQELLLLRMKEELLKEQRKVEEYLQLESSMQFEIDSLKESMHCSRDHGKALQALQEELDAEKEKVAKLSKSKMSLQSKLRVLQQASESTKASAFVQERETDMVLASTQKNLDAATKANEDLKDEIHKLNLKHKNNEAALEKEYNQKLSDYTEVKEDFENLKKELAQSHQWTTELTSKISILQAEAVSLQEDNKLLSVTLDEKQQSLLELEHVQDELIKEQRKAEELENDKLSLETQLRVAMHAAQNANASAGVRVWETEMILSNTRKELEDALNQNQELSVRLSSLDTSMREVRESCNKKLNEADRKYKETKSILGKETEAMNILSEKVESLELEKRAMQKEKEELLERTAALARRDQIQKASLRTSEEEITILQSTINQFEERFQHLAEQLNQLEGINAGLDCEKENIRKNFEKQQNQWADDRTALLEQVKSLEKEAQDSQDALENVRLQYNHVHAREVDLQTRFDSCRLELETLEQQKVSWGSERNLLTQRIQELTAAVQDSTEAADIVRKESIKSSQQMMEDMQSQWNAERELLKGRLSVLSEELQLAHEEIHTCKDKILDMEAQIDETKKNLKSQIAFMEEEMLDTRVALQNAEQNQRESAILQTELQTKSDCQLLELESCRRQLSSEKKRADALETQVADKQKDVQSLEEQLESHKDRVQGLQAERDRLSEELATKLRIAVESSRHERMKQVESDLDEAQMRESLLESLLSDCKKELLVCKEELELCKKEVFDEKYCNGVYKELISKLNRANDSLEQTNKKLMEDMEQTKGEQVTHDRNNQSSLHNRALMDENAFLRNQKEKFTLEISNMDCQLRALVGERDSLKATAVSLQEQVDSLQHANDELEVAVKKLELLQLEGAQEQNQRLEEELVKSQKAVTEVSNKAKGMRHKLSQEIDAARAKEASLTKEMMELKTHNQEMEKRLEEQEKELDEFEQDFALARDDARKVVEELRAQVLELEKRNQQLTADNTVQKVDELKNKLRQLISQNQRLQKDIEGFKSREKKLQRELGLGGWK
jgi:chromosome segregation ATPase